MIDVELQGITKRFGDYIAVNNISLGIEKGEFLSFLGPSGCGKTTTLRMIAGLEEPSEGSIFIKGKRVNNVPPFMRNIGMVFQNYALFPHKSVFENVAYGLRMRQVGKKEIRRRVGEILDLVQLSNLENRMPRQLSGGQQQRVALARALVINPDVLLLDEPLSNLDAKLREEMRVETKKIQQEVGITTIYVTHDQVEALSMSDRIVIMKEGEIIQIGSPKEIYEAPKESFVAEFIGQSNCLVGKVIAVKGEEVEIRTDTGLMISARAGEQLEEGKHVKLYVRVESIEISERHSLNSKNVFEGLIESASFQGWETVYYIKLYEGTRLVAKKNRRESRRNLFERDSRVLVFIRPEDLILMPG